jgi:hypothetical protein
LVHELSEIEPSGDDFPAGHFPLHDVAPTVAEYVPAAQLVHTPPETEL